MEEEAEFIQQGLQDGFDAGIPSISTTYTPPNGPSVEAHEEAFQALIRTEFEQGRYLGPYTRAEVEEMLGPFQTSPLSIIPKPGRAGRFRIVQNLSHPHSPRKEQPQIQSINARIVSDNFPCTWGTFVTVYLIIARLPEGSQAAVRDVKEAYRTVGIHFSQWAGIVVRLPGEDNFAVDTCDCFGLASGAGIYGRVADTGAQLLRLHGIGPLSKWVDDHIFFRIPRNALQGYNEQRRQWAKEIAEEGGRRHDGGRIWYRGKSRDEGLWEEYDEDCTAEFRALPQRAPDGGESEQGDDKYTYSMADIDDASAKLGIRWEHAKDVPFTWVVPFAGFQWDLRSREVGVSMEKREKYKTAVDEWAGTKTHTLEQVQQLHGKLVHISHVLPEGRAYLTRLEAFMGVFGDSPFKPRTPPRNTDADIAWWRNQLEHEPLTRPIRPPQPVLDIEAFSDASSEVGIGIVIGKRWRAWRLLPGWKAEGRDIGWAEAVGFLLLTLAIISAGTKQAHETHYRAYGDNRGVVEGWWRGKSRNEPTNLIFRSLHQICKENGIRMHTRYVPTERNPADDPSRGVFGPPDDVLPHFPIPAELQSHIIDYDSPRTATELRHIRQGRLPQPAAKSYGNVRHRSAERAHQERDAARASATKDVCFE